MHFINRGSLKVTFVFLILLGGLARAEGSFGDKSKWGIDVERLQNGGSGQYGVLLGFKHVGYFDSSSAYLGYEIHSGTDRGGSLNGDNLTYGGLSLGFDGNYFKTISYDFSILAGYGFGNVSSLQLSGQSLALQPTVSLGLIMMAGYRATFNASYLYMPGASGFSTWLFGIRLERKVSSTSSGSSE